MVAASDPVLTHTLWTIGFRIVLHLRSSAFGRQDRHEIKAAGPVVRILFVNVVAGHAVHLPPLAGCDPVGRIVVGLTLATGGRKSLEFWCRALPSLP